ncbi:MAG: 2Fe-2S iron-sulfur cluster-binding protein [Dehalococcoidia bacterium]|nr:NADPH-Fe(3+) oxidoreductase subunit alpha [Chloroflexota bacterium]MBT9160641.1 NADPH-Fe(3+) oxidoreductase subunit alpha [Chloroflexota bacterium]MBT9162513.1 NADPH-Fe(3+) oxidoreductase subunit alpha [Chloroflexota bacterium]
MDKIAFTIDGSDIVADRGTTILEAALQNGIYIPHLCYHPALKPSGVCRLCIVETGEGQLVISCRTPVEEGIVVKVKSPEVDKVRRAFVELLIANHHTDCRNCPSNRHCELQRVMAYLRISKKRMRPLRLPKEELPLETLNPFFDYDPNRCVLCGICVQACEDVQGVSALKFVGRGYSTKIAFFGDKSQCESCRECMLKCPVGALLAKGDQKKV